MMKKTSDKYQLLHLLKKEFDCVKGYGSFDFSSYHLIQLKTGDWVPIITKNGVDIITGEIYYKDHCHYADYFFYNRRFVPYFIYEHRSFNKLHSVLSLTNYSDYNKIFYTRFYDVCSSEIMEYLKIIQSAGKQTYIDGINNYRDLIMDSIYRKNKVYNNKISIGDEVKKLINKIK